MNIDKLDRNLKFIHLSNLLENYEKHFTYLNIELFKLLKYENVYRDIEIIDEHHNDIKNKVNDIINKFKVNN